MTPSWTHAKRGIRSNPNEFNFFLDSFRLRVTYDDDDDYDDDKELTVMFTLYLHTKFHTPVSSNS
jgi:hypothetical protein